MNNPTIYNAISISSTLNNYIKAGLLLPQLRVVLPNK